jgi:quercetin dioxygenase-like cupin family protein
MSELIKNIEHKEVLKLKEIVGYKDNKVSSRTLAATPGTNMTLLSLDAGEELSTHAAPGDAFVNILDGEVKITIDGEPYELGEGDAIVMPSGVPHSLYAKTKFKMLLVVVK